MPKGESNKFVYDTSPQTGKPLTTHQWYDGTPASVGVQARLASGAVAHRSRHGLRRRRGRGPVPLDRRRTNLAGTPRTARPRHRPPLAAGRGRHVPAHHHSRSQRSQRIYIAISAAGAFRTDDGGKTWKPINRGLHSQYIPDPTAEVGHCVHHIAMHPSRPGVLFMQKHWDVMRSDDAGDIWHEVSGNLPTDFGFAIDVHAHEPETIYVVPIKSDSRALSARGQAARLSQPHRRQRVGAAHQRPAAKNCYVNVLRDAMAVDSLDTCGVYFGTTGGQVYASADAGDSWKPIVRDLPAVLSVEVQTLP